MSKEGTKNKCRSRFCGPQDSGICNACRYGKDGGTTCVEDPRLQASGMTSLYTKAGFTLIELLIVVLIIGILTAVAVPMYKHATLKSQFSTVMPPTKSLAEAQEVFYLNNGEYAEDKEELDLSVPDTAQTTVTVSDKRNYKFVKGHHTGVPGANYIVYQKNSKRFADNIHCEAAKSDDAAQWLCEKGLGGTPLTGSISGANYLTYLLSGDAGTDKFLREDCPAGKYDNNGTCTTAPKGYYADEGELKPCELGTARDIYKSADSCSICGAGQYTDEEGSIYCKTCPKGTYQPEAGQSSCISCPAGTARDIYTSGDKCITCGAGTYATGGATSCANCPRGTYQPKAGQSSCISCPAGTARDIYTSGDKCITCGAGTYATGGATSCANCPRGTYQPEAGQSSCISCPVGTARDIYTSGDKCITCGTGKYADVEGLGECKTCPSGQTNNADHTGCVPA